MDNYLPNREKIRNAFDYLNDDNGENVFKSLTGATESAITDNERQVEYNSSKSALLKTYQTDPTSYACVKAIAREFATTEFYIQRIINANGDTQDIQGHEFIDTLYCPNAYQTKTQFLEMICIHMLVFGEVFMRHIYSSEDNDTELVGLEIIPPQYMQVKVVANELVFEYTSPTTAGVVEKFNSEQITYIITPSAEAPLVPLSPMKTLAGTNYITTKARDYQIGTFTGGDIPAHTYFKVDKSENIETFADDSIKDLVKKQMQSINNIGKGRTIPMVLGGELVSVKLSPNEIDFTRTMERLAEIKLATFGVPAVKLGKIEEANRASSQVVDAIFSRDVVEPYVKIVTEKLQKALIERFYDVTFVLKYEELVGKLDDQKVGAIINLHNANIIRTEEAREQIGFDTDVEVDNFGDRDREEDDTTDTSNKVMKDTPRELRQRFQHNTTAKAYYESIEKAKVETKAQLKNLLKSMKAKAKKTNKRKARVSKMNKQAVKDYTTAESKRKKKTNVKRKRKTNK